LAAGFIYLTKQLIFMPTIKSKQTGLEQTVSQETYDKMNDMKPGLHTVIKKDAPTPPEVHTPGAVTGKQKVLAQGTGAATDTESK
jgi:hypothetical protein